VARIPAGYGPTTRCSSRETRRKKAVGQVRSAYDVEQESSRRKQANGDGARRAQARSFITRGSRHVLDPGSLSALWPFSTVAPDWKRRRWSVYPNDSTSLVTDGTSILGSRERMMIWGLYISLKDEPFSTRFIHNRLVATSKGARCRSRKGNVIDPSAFIDGLWRGTRCSFCVARGLAQPRHILCAQLVKSNRTWTTTVEGLRFAPR